MSDAERQPSRVAATLVTLLVIGAAVAVAVVLTSRRKPEPEVAPGARLRAAMAGLPDGMLLQAEGTPVSAGAAWVDVGERLASSPADVDTLGELVVDYPNDQSVFPPDLIPPTFLWHDDDSDADLWLVEFEFGDGAPPLRAILPDRDPPSGEIDREVLGSTNEIYPPTEYQASARAWTPVAPVWEEIKKRSVKQMAVVTFRGFDSKVLDRVRTRGASHLQTSVDPVGAPIFYRDVPLLPDPGEKGRIQPLPRGILPYINWRLRDVSLPESKIVLRAVPSCANCHSFTRDGSTLAMDVEGPQSDRGAYAIAPIEKQMVIDSEQVITWNSFPDKPKDHSTIGFLSRISPDGRFTLTTVNEELYVANFLDYKLLQVFYPTRGILAWHSAETGEMKALPGADDTTYVHCNPVWTPDGKEIVFSRAKAFDPYEDDKPLATRANDPNEPPIRYDLYRMPFNDGKGGTPVPVEGASQNDMSNTFPKISPDGKWIVYTKCKNGLLLRPDGRLWIVPFEGGEAREMRCNTSYMNSWHSFSPNGRWLVFSSKVNRPYTQMFLTHIDEDGNDTPYVLIPNSTADNRAVNLPEFANIPYDALDSIKIPAVNHHLTGAEALVWQLELSLKRRPDDLSNRLTLAWTLATSKRDAIRNGERAVEHAEIAVATTKREQVSPLDVLAAAYAEAGRFEDAVKTLEEALALIRQMGEPIPADIDARLRRYRAGQPYRSEGR